MDVASLEAEAQDLILPQFTETTALDLGMVLVRMAQDGALPIVINIRTADRTLFHAALPGSTPLNDLWARRKGNTALLFQLPSFLVGTRNRAKNETLARHGLDPADYADNGGAVPIRVAGAGVVAVVTVSGLPQAEDHALVVQAIRQIMLG